MRTLATLVVAALVSACAPLAQRSDMQPVVSPADDRQYRYLELPNQLQVLLISDVKTPKAAAALDVNVGSGDNPRGRGGLAHFLEHMLFLGTEKYPDSAEYERYISEHGGSRNAYTSFEHTNYFFDIDAQYLAGGLDRFAQFFIAPTLDAAYVSREKNAVQAEYKMGLNSDGRRALDVLQTVMNPDHPYSQFSVGSLKTLADRPGSPVRDELLAFYREHYSANNMRLVVYGAQSLDALQALVEPIFSKVPNHDVSPAFISAPMFAEGALPQLVTVQPRGSMRQLDVNFPVGDYRDDYMSKPLAYIGGLIGHEGEGSLLSLLKQKGLAEGLSAGTGLAWRGGSLFSVSINLTERGLQRYDDVLRLLFQYLAMLRETGPQSDIYEEQAKLAALDFEFQEKGTPINRVTGLAAAMHRYRARDILRGPYYMVDFSSDMIAEVLTNLRADNAQVVLTAADVPTDKVSPYYNVPYSAGLVSPATLAKWTAPAEAEHFALPRPNPFIAEDVALLPPVEGAADQVQLIHNSAREQLWYAQSASFRVPRGALYANFRSPVINASLDDAAAAALYVALLKDRVNEYAYEAQLAGLSFDVYRHAQGISLRISGYTDKQNVLLKALVEDIRNAQFEPQRFKDIRADLILQLDNYKTQRPSRQVMRQARRALVPGTRSEAALAKALATIDRSDVDAFAEAFWRGADVRIMAYGNYSKDDAQDAASSLRVLLTGDAANPPRELSVVNIEPGQRFMYPVTVDHDDSVVLWYLQGERNDWHDRAAAALTAKIIGPDFFQQLRTEQQLGYIVSAFYYPQWDVPALAMLIQSPVADAKKVDDAMRAFFDKIPDVVKADQFARHKVALISEVTEPDKNLWERAEFYWQALASKDQSFDSREQMTSAIEALSFENWQEYVGRVFKHNPRSLLLVAPGGKQVLPEVNGYERVQTIESLQRQTRRYLVN